jgi:dihydrofolate reductase
MRKLIAAMRLSLDGRSEGSEGYADWVQAWSDDYGLMGRIDACLLGGRMYPGYENYWSAIRNAPDRPLPMTGRLPQPAERAWSDFAQRTPHYVLSATLPSAAWPQTRLLRHVDEVRELKAREGRDIYLMGGATLIGNLLDLGLVDEMHYILYPLIAGPARGPFERLTRRQDLRLVGQRPLGDQLIHLAYEVR